MHIIILLILSIGVYNDLFAQSSLTKIKGGAEQVIEDAKWKNRILLVCSKSYNAPDASFFQQSYKNIDFAGFREREILIVSVLEKPRIAWVLSNNQYGSDPKMWIAPAETDVEKLTELGACHKGQNSVALIGKDGSMKKTWVGDFPKNEELFSLIDAMPMRQQEMRQQSDGN